MKAQAADERPLFDEREALFGADVLAVEHRKAIVLAYRRSPASPLEDDRQYVDWIELLGLPLAYGIKSYFGTIENLHAYIHDKEFTGRDMLVIRNGKTKKERALIAASLYEMGLTFDEVGERCGHSAKWVMRTLRRAREAWLITPNLYPRRTSQRRLDDWYATPQQLMPRPPVAMTDVSATDAPS